MISWSPDLKTNSQSTLSSPQESLWNFQQFDHNLTDESLLYRVFKLDLHQTKRLLGHQKCTFKSLKWYLHIHETRNFDKKNI